MLLVGALFAAVGYLLVGSALVFELTQFHLLLDDFFATQTIFIVLAPIVRALSMMPVRLGSLLQESTNTMQLPNREGGPPLTTEPHRRRTPLAVGG